MPLPCESGGRYCDPYRSGQGIFELQTILRGFLGVSHEFSWEQRLLASASSQLAQYRELHGSPDMGPLYDYFPAVPRTS